MSGFDLSTINLAQQKYNKDIPVILKATVDFMSMVPEERWEGDQIEGRLQTSLVNSVGNAAGDGTQFPNPDYPRHVTYKVGRRFFHGNVQITDAAVAAARGGPNSFASALDTLIRLSMQSAVEYHNLMFPGDGTGIVAGLASANPNADSTALKLTSQYEVTGGTDKQSAHARGIWKHQTYDILDASASYAVIDQITVSAVAPLTSASQQLTATIDAAVSATAAQYDPVCWPGAFGVAFSGLRRLVDAASTGTFQGVNLANNPEYSSVVLANGGALRALTTSLVRQLMQGLVEASGTGKVPDGLVFMAHPAQLTKFSELFESAVLMAPSDQVASTGVTAMNTPFGVVKLKPSDYIPPACLYALTPSELRFAVQLPLGWRMSAGQMMTKSQVAPVSTAQLYEVAELYIKNRRKCGVIRDLDYSLVFGA